MLSSQKWNVTYHGFAHMFMCDYDVIILASSLFTLPGDINESVVLNCTLKIWLEVKISYKSFTFLQYFKSNKTD